MSKNQISGVPLTPSAESDLPTTRDYLEYHRKIEQPLKIRDLIGFWGYKGRGARNIEIVNGDLSKMGFRIVPPLDSGSLDTQVHVVNAESGVEEVTRFERPDEHLLGIARIRSTTFALQTAGETEDGTEKQILKVFTPDTPIDLAITLMSRLDFSQVPVVNDEHRFHPIGALSWESFAQAHIRGSRPSTVGEAMSSAHYADLSSDLFSCIETVLKHEFLLVTHQGRLTGIVTATDLIDELAGLTKPFLAIGRCERELRRVAGGALRAALESANTPLEDMTFGNIQYFYKDNWDELNWSLSKEEFVQWLDDTRNLRNKIAHFESQDTDYSNEIKSVDRLTRWLSGLRFDLDNENDSELAPAGAKA